MGKNQTPDHIGLDGWTTPEMSELGREFIRNDPATKLAESKGQKIEILHIPSGQSVVFKAYITDYQDKYDSEWNSTDVYGRMDPIHQFQGTKRVISLDWEVPSVSRDEAKLHHDKCSLLFSMLYPSYNSANPSSATQISTAPIFKVKFGNLIKDPNISTDGGTVEDSGLVGSISGFTYSPDVEAGFIDEGYLGTLYPKLIKLSMEYTVFHTNGLGWNGTRKRTLGFPYGLSEAARQALEDESRSGIQSSGIAEEDTANQEEILK